VTTSLRDTLVEVLADQTNCPPEEIEDTSSIVEDLGADSLDQLELLMTCEERFGVEIPEEMAEEWVTVGQALAWLETHGAQVMPTPVKGW
jgi:acyl carrier protein